MTNSRKKKLSAKQFLSDIRSGMDATALKSKYGLSDKSLETAFRKLLEAGALKEHERPLPGPMPTPTRRSHREPKSAEWRCPSCGSIQESEVPECPVCGVVVAKFIARQGQGYGIPDVSRTSLLHTGLSEGKSWTSVVVSIVVIVLIGGALMIWSRPRVPEKTEIAELDLRAQRSHNVQSQIDRPDENTMDEQATSIENPEAEIGDSRESNAVLSPMIPVPPELPSAKASPPVEKTPLPVEKPPAPGSTTYVTGVLRHFHYRDFKTEVVEASKTYPVLFQFYSDS